MRRASGKPIRSSPDGTVTMGSHAFQPAFSVIVGRSDEQGRLWPVRR